MWLQLSRYLQPYRSLYSYVSCYTHTRKSLQRTDQGEFNIDKSINMCNGIHEYCFTIIGLNDIINRVKVFVLWVCGKLHCLYFGVSYTDTCLSMYYGYFILDNPNSCISGCLCIECLVLVLQSHGICCWCISDVVLCLCWCSWLCNFLWSPSCMYLLQIIYLPFVRCNNVWSTIDSLISDYPKL